MLTRVLTLAITTALACTAGVARAATATFSMTDGRTLVMSYNTMDILASKKVALQGKPARIKLFEKTGVLTFDASADAVVVNPSGLPGAKAPAGLASAELTGSAYIAYETTDAGTGKRLKTTASGDRAEYDGTTDTVRLQGSVKVQIEDPTLFEGPGQITGEEAMIRLGTGLGPDDVRFRVSSSPGVSAIRATPKSKEEAGPPK